MCLWRHSYAGTESRTRTGVNPPDPKSGASANSAIPAYLMLTHFIHGMSVMWEVIVADDSAQL